MTKRAFKLANGTTVALEWDDANCTLKTSRVVLEPPEHLSTVAVLTLDDARELGLYLAAFIVTTETLTEDSR